VLEPETCLGEGERAFRRDRVEEFGINFQRQEKIATTTGETGPSTYIREKRSDSRNMHERPAE